MSTRQRALRMSSARASRSLAERQLEADVARAAALRERGRGDVGDAVRLERVLEEVPPRPWLKSATASGPYSRLDLLQLLGDEAERLVPGDLGPLLLAAHARAHQRRAQAVGVEVGADAAGAARAQPAARERVVGVALDLPEDAVADRRDRVALPEAQVAEGRHRAHALLDRPPRRAETTRERAEDPGRGRGRGARSGDLEEPPSGEWTHAGAAHSEPRASARRLKPRPPAGRDRSLKRNVCNRPFR